MTMLDHTGPVWCKTIDYLPQEAIELLPWPAMSPVLNPRIFMGLFRTKMHVPQSVKRFRNQGLVMFMNGNITMNTD